MSLMTRRAVPDSKAKAMSPKTLVLPDHSARDREPQVTLSYQYSVESDQTDRLQKAVVYLVGTALKFLLEWFLPGYWILLHRIDRECAGVKHVLTIRNVVQRNMYVHKVMLETRTPSPQNTPYHSHSPDGLNQPVFSVQLVPVVE